VTGGHDALLARVSAYYGSRIREHGETARGVDWNSTESQTLRFEQLLRILPDGPGRADHEPTLLDYGCGYGALADFLDAGGVRVRYVGCDVSAEMIERARGRPGAGKRSFVTDPRDLEPVDYAVASGVLNVKLETPLEDWEAYALDVLVELDRLSTRGFAFNALTSWSDPERMRDELWYPDPAVVFDHCKRTFSPQVALLHDYGLWEFTILVRKDLA
jgi:SAM-dependent methyltransferase